ncbi:hypothetical protein M3N64_12395 [Sporolactobacillus sp. CPB3-1]|uniref:DUF3899 domain-containing protein n=1 Tax=Sporolactobacillus mangiferae TaxID=2940498 RepID=A0ABT0MEM7_9BACL|nr:hypothetical protein [Sporolactobacillus mangiferae]MCL1632719.1 hypothetical protein [Sporolactobacillus mangiferae]
MAALWIAILFWILGCAVLIMSFFLTHKIRETGEHLLKDAEHEKSRDDSASIAMTIEGQVLEHIPSYLIHMVTAFLGLTLIVFGVVALAFYVH